jgi:mono/diheme cytochrome c family protein
VVAASVLVAATPRMTSATPANGPRWGGTIATEGFHPIGPPLVKLAAKLADPNWLVAWLLHPSRLRAHQQMRRLRIQVDEARVLAGYLYTGASPPGGSEVAWQGGDARMGKLLFVSRGCRGCHTIDSSDLPPVTRAPDLAGIGVKVRPEWLFGWLKSPRSYDPNTAMPQLALGDDDIRDLVAFLMSHREGATVVAAAPRFTPGGPADAARATIARFDCARCHLINGFEKIESTTKWTAVPRSCGSCHQSSDSSRLSWATTADDSRPDDLVLENGRMLVAYYSCRGCHRIEGSGGVIAEHLERKTFAPPTLDGEGARVQPSWLIEFLQRPTNLRPWLQMRMPDFGLSAPEATALARYFAALAHVSAVDEPRSDAPGATVDAGRRRFVHFKCMQCHAAGDDAEPCTVDADDLSIDLMLVKTRLRPSWVRDFLARPKAIVGVETRMPAVFYSTDGMAKVEDPKHDIAAIAAYLFKMTEPARDLGSGKEERPVDWSVYPY